MWVFTQGRFLPALALLGVCIPALAQQAPLSADEVIRRVVQMNEHMANALESYSSIRSYHIEARLLSYSKVLFRGCFWVDAKDFAIVQVEREPSVNPSW
jgi:hypothetical protein